MPLWKKDGESGDAWTARRTRTSAGGEETARGRRGGGYAGTWGARGSKGGGWETKTANGVAKTVGFDRLRI